MTYHKDGGGRRDLNASIDRIDPAIEGNRSVKRFLRPAWGVPEGNRRGRLHIDELNQTAFGVRNVQLDNLRADQRYWTNLLCHKNLPKTYCC